MVCKMKWCVYWDQWDFRDKVVSSFFFNFCFVRNEDKVGRDINAIIGVRNDKTTNEK